MKKSELYPGAIKSHQKVLNRKVIEANVHLEKSLWHDRDGEMEMLTSLSR